MTSDESFMKQAVKQAKKAYDKLETPIGCVIVHEQAYFSSYFFYYILWQ